MIIRILWWIFVTLIGILLVIILLPLIILFALIVLILGMFSRPTFRVWTSRAQSGAQTVKSKLNEHAPSSIKSQMPGQRKSKVVDADVKDI